MRITRLYQPNALQCGETIQLNHDASNHLIRVLRTKTGSAVTLFNGDGFDYFCTTLDNNTKKTTLSINSKSATNKESNLNITLIQGLSRNERMENCIQKSVELGVNKIIPVICQRSNIKLSKEKLTKKRTHWQKIIIGACEQSGRCCIPVITEVISVNDLDTILHSDAIKLTLNPTARTSLKNINADILNKNIELFIGPEGGLNEEELLYLKDKQFKEIGFGPRVLRTETAGPAVISAIQMLWGDF